MTVRDDHAEPPELSAIVLCYRARESILDVIEPLRLSLEELGVGYELVLVANWWSEDQDPTPSIVASYARDHDTAVAVSSPKQGAMGWDMRTGLNAARGAFVIVIDGDAQNPVSDVARMYREMKASGIDVMKGRRVARHDGLKRRVISEGYNTLFRLMFRTRGLWDINGKPKGLTRAALDQITLRSDDWFVDAEIVLEARRLGLRIGEMPVIFKENTDRSSFVRMGAVVEFMRNMIRRRIGPRA